MPIRIPNDLPAADVLQQENIFVMNQNRAGSQRQFIFHQKQSRIL